MRHYFIAPLLLLFVPAAASAGPTFIYKPQYNTRHLPYRPSAEDQLRATEERLMKEHNPAPPALSSADVEMIIDKKNQELLNKIAALRSGGLNYAPNNNSNKKTEAEIESPFGKVGGLGTVGGIGAVGGAGILAPSSESE